MATINGDNNANTLNGTNDADEINGRGGDDTINGLGGNDQLNGEEGNDKINGGDGDDVITGDNVETTFRGQDTTDLGTVSLIGSTLVGGSGNLDNAQVGNFAVFANAVTLADGTKASMRVTVEDKSNPNLRVDLDVGPDGGLRQFFLNQGGGAPAGSTVELKLEFFDPATGDPVNFNGYTTFVDIDRVSGNGTETVNLTDGFVGYSLAPNAAINPTTEADGSTSLNGLINTNPGDTRAWASAYFVERSEVTVTLTARASTTGYSLRPDTIPNEVLTTIVGQNDMIDGGDGNDIIEGNAGDDMIQGGSGDDQIDGGEGVDQLMGGSGNDQIQGGQGDDVIMGGSGDDFIDGGTGNDNINAGSGNDGVSGGDGNDTIDGGTGNDTIDGGAGNDVIDGNVGNDTLSGGAGADTIAGGSGEDTIDGGTGNDTIDGGTGDDEIDGGTGNDVIAGGDGNDTIVGGFGNDTIDGGSGDDFIFTGTRDPLDDDGPQNGDTDVARGGDGNDTIFGGGDNDQLFGEADRDRIVIDNIGNNQNANVTVDGGSGGDDFDTLDLDPLLNAGFTEIVNNVRNPENDGNPGFDGQITLRNPTTGETVNVNFQDIEAITPICFSPGARIATRTGERLVEDLREGDAVITRDNGIREIAWAGRRTLSAAELALRPHLRPVLIRAGALGGGLPERDMLVSPNHRMLLTGAEVQLTLGESEALAAAKHLTGRPGIDRVLPEMGITYCHIMFERHEIVLSDGAWTESFQPGDWSMKGLESGQRDEIHALFPELAGEAGLEGYRAARASLGKREVAALV